MKKRILSLCLVLVLLATAVIGGTLAYFTDTDAADNTFTVGNIDIELIEQQKGENGKLEDFAQNKQLMPGTSQDKIVTVENVGGNDAYVRVTIIIPEGMTAIWPTSVEDWTRTPAEGNGANTYVYTSTAPLAAGATTPVLLDGVMLNGDVNELNKQDTYTVPVSVEAIQAEGFNGDSTAAYAALASENVANTKVASTPNDLNNALAAGNAVVQLGDNVVGTGLVMGDNTVVDGNGNALTVANAADVQYNAGIKTDEGTIKNITITGEQAGGKGFRAVYAPTGLTNNLVIDNATLTGTYALNITDNTGVSKNSTLTVKNSTLNGWVSFAPVASATFDKVDFVTTGENAVFRAYSDTTLSNCNFAAGYELDNPSSVPYLTITMNNVTIDGKAVTAAEVATQFITADFHGTIIVDGTSVRIG